MDGLFGEKKMGAETKAEAEAEAEGSGEMSVDSKALKADAARSLISALGLSPDKLNVDEVAAALEDFVACCEEG